MGAAANTPSPLSAREILERTAATYASCRSYSDQGVVTNIYTSKWGKHLDEKPFATRFIRPDLFRFDFQDRFFPYQRLWTRFVVWSIRGKTLEWWTVTDPKAARESSLGEALSGATGISGGSAHRIPKLLLPDEIPGRSIAQLGDPELTGEELIDGHTCYRIEGIYGNSNKQIVWVGKEDLLIRRVDESNQFADVDTTTYEPLLNPNVEVGTFSFNPARPVSIADNVPSHLFYKGKRPTITSGLSFHDLFPIWGALFAIFFFVTGLRGLIQKRPFLISMRWQRGLLVTLFLGFAIDAVRLDWESGNAGGLQAATWMSVAFLALAIWFFLLQAQGYLALGVTDESLRDTLLSALRQSNLAYEERLSTIRIPSENAQFQVAVQSWMGAAQIRVKGKASGALLRRIVKKVNENFSVSKPKAKMTTFTFHLIFGVLMFGLCAAVWLM
jgi:hypothetical protein